MSIVIGIDTSCYTTSICAVDINEKLLADYRKVLEVKQGNRGLRQSEAVFQHMNNLPNLISRLSGLFSNNIIAVAAASKPRSVEGSYMPVFTASINIGQVMASCFGVKLLTFSHQEGHIRAGIWSAGGPNDNEFIAIHLSGGTTEVVKVKQENYSYSIDLVGSTLDISAGQLIDRIGVALGLGFPCGKELEKIAVNGDNNVKVPSSVKGTNMSFSGAETFLMSKINDYSPADIAYGVQQCIAETLKKVIINASKKSNLSKVLIVGGVASNSYIKDYLKSKLHNYCLFFAKPEYSVDNSVGVALLGVDYAKANFNCK